MSSANLNKLSILIISYNTREKLLRCLRKLTTRFSSWKVIVIDNNSKDGSFEAVKKKFNTKIILKKNKKNLGFAKAVNQGIKATDSEHILLLNPDTIPEAGAIEKLLNFFKKNEQIGIVGGRLIRPHSKGIHGTFVNKPSLLTGIFEFTNLKKIFKDNPFHKKFYYKNDKIIKTKDVWGVSGAFMLLRKRVVEEIGLFDENFFMYLEDIDFCLRAKRAGYRVVFNPHAVIIHESGSSSLNRYRINVKAWRNSRKYFFRKHFGLIGRCILQLSFFLDELVVDLKHFIFDDD